MQESAQFRRTDVTQPTAAEGQQLNGDVARLAECGQRFRWHADKPSRGVEAQKTGLVKGESCVHNRDDRYGHVSAPAGRFRTVWPWIAAVQAERVEVAPKSAARSPAAANDGANGTKNFNEKRSVRVELGWFQVGAWKNSRAKNGATQGFASDAR